MENQLHERRGSNIYSKDTEVLMCSHGRPDLIASVNNVFETGSVSAVQAGYS